MILKRDVAPVAGQGHPSLSRAAPSTSSKQDQKHPCGEIPPQKKSVLVPKVSGAWSVARNSSCDPTSFGKQNVPTGEAGSQVWAGTASFPRVMRSRRRGGVSFAVK